MQQLDDTYKKFVMLNLIQLSYNYYRDITYDFASQELHKDLNDEVGVILTMVFGQFIIIYIKGMCYTE